MIVGVLALQGDFYLHSKLLFDNNINNILITKPSQLNNINSLIIPGGESTVILKLLLNNNFTIPLNEFSKVKSIFGTCAGAIVMSKKTNNNMKTLNYINVDSYKNFWGRQVNSFTDDINLTFNNKNFNAHFIRAPRFKCLSENLEVLSYYNDIPVLIRNHRHLISSFHPEMTEDFTIHKYFLEMANG